MTLGFRRSGLFNYKPYCDHCDQCIPYRVVTSKFVPTRSQKRTFNKWNHLKEIILPLQFKQEHFNLFLTYQSHRHPDGGMDDDSQEQYSDFLVQSNVNSQLIEFRDSNNQLKMISIVDYLKDGLSSVYTFFDPHAPSGLGIYNIVWQIKQCCSLGLPYLYLGYYIENSRKMNYKRHFQPAEIYRNKHWLSYKANSSAHYELK